MEILIVFASGSIAVVQMIFKEFRNTFRKLMIFYNLAKIIQVVGALIATFLHFSITLHSTMPCYLFYFLIMQSSVLSEIFAIALLAYFAYIVRHSCKCMYRSDKANKQEILQRCRNVCSWFIASV